MDLAADSDSTHPTSLLKICSLVDLRSGPNLISHGLCNYYAIIRLLKGFPSIQ